METLVVIAINAAIFAAVVFIVFTFFSEGEKALGEFREEQVKQGDVGLAELSLAISPEVFFFLRLAGAGIGAYVTVLVSGVFLAAVVGILLFFGPQLWLARARAKRVRKFEEQLVEGLELLGNSLKSGLTLQQASELLIKEFPAPISQEFALMMAETRLGVEFTDALQNMADRLGSNITQILASGVAITKRCGGDMTQIFQNIASTIREQAKIEGKLEAVTAQGRFQGLILSCMPFALMVILYFVDQSHVQTLFEYTLGNWAIILVIFMVAMAQLWISRLLSVDV